MNQRIKELEEKNAELERKLLATQGALNKCLEFIASKGRSLIRPVTHEELEAFNKIL